MSEKSNIEWTDATWTTITGCARVSPGCANCYAERMTATRLREQPKYKGLAVITPAGEQHWTGEIRLHESELATPLSWLKPRMVFVNSMSDTFHNDVPKYFLDRLFSFMARCSQHTFQVLTKRAERMRDYMQSNLVAPPPNVWLCGAPPPNVWLGVSVEDQKRADQRIPLLLQTPASVRFLSVEPLLSPIELNVPAYVESGTWGMTVGPKCGLTARPWSPATVDWVIVGGESGPGARPCKVEWIRSVVQQCKAANVPCFVKQLGSALRRGKGGDMNEWPEDLRVREFPTVQTCSSS